MQLSKRYSEIDFIRFFLIVWIIMIHVGYFTDAYPSVKPYLGVCSVPAFLFLTGYLTNVDKPIRHFTKTWVQYIGLYCVMEITYSVMSFYLPVRDGITSLTAEVLFRNLLLHPIGPYWYLHTMVLSQGIYYICFHLIHQKRISAIALYVSLNIFLCEYFHILPFYSYYFLIGAIIRQTTGCFELLFKSSKWMLLPLSVILVIGWNQLTELFLVYAIISTLMVAD